MCVGMECGIADSYKRYGSVFPQDPLDRCCVHSESWTRWTGLFHFV